MKRVIRDRHLTPEEAAQCNQARTAVMSEFPKDYSKLSDNEINLFVAMLVMDWRKFESTDDHGFIFDPINTFQIAENSEIYTDGTVLAWINAGVCVWNPVADRNATAAMRAALKDRGLQNRFVEELSWLVNDPEPQAENNLAMIFAMVDASGRQQCEAALLTVTKDKP